MKRYQTKTGIELTVVNGLGQGDGIPRGRLSLVTPPSQSTLDWLDTLDLVYDPDHALVLAGLANVYLPKRRAK